ncbi:SPASM domain-containing protein [Streptomyces sp. C10-9-1]|uniref:SPASM domain-containing protein n=1 Tax=Streptomyces sp. C10-9-1 TaxID=1859285 RepID=UPI003F49F9EF
MTTVLEPPAASPLAGIRSLELEITGRCQLTCTHCLSESSPQASHGTMTPADWRAVITDAAALGGATVRAGIVDILPGQRVAEARAELESMGVKHINTDRVRAVGRAALPGQAPTLDEMCGRCTRGRAAILPNGNVAGCVLSRDFPAGNVRETPLAEVFGGAAWAELAASVPPLRANACPPDDSGDCDPANTEACDPAY